VVEMQRRLSADKTCSCTHRPSTPAHPPTHPSTHLPTHQPAEPNRTETNPPVPRSLISISAPMRSNISAQWRIFRAGLASSSTCCGLGWMVDGAVFGCLGWGKGGMYEAGRAQGLVTECSGGVGGWRRATMRSDQRSHITSAPEA